MSQKTKIHAEDGKQEIIITREFELPVNLLFKAYEDPEIVAQWMNTKVVKLENKKHGGWRFETSDPSGNVVFSATGVIHDFIPGKKIVRTFEMDSAGFPVQLEFLDFEPITKDTSKLTVLIVFKSAEARNNQLRLPFAQGLNMAHNLLQQIVEKLK